MPLGKISLDSVLGLNTERNDTSGINPPAWTSMGAWAVENAASGATSPNTLLDCSNIIISRNKQAAARTAFAESWDFTSTYGSVASFFTTGMYAIPNSTTNSLIFGWQQGTSTVPNMLNDADIANFATNANYNMKSTINIIGGSQSSNFSSYPYLRSDFQWNTTTFPIKSFNITRYVTSYNNIYVFSSNGLFRSTDRYLSNITSSTYNQFKRVTLPLVKSLSAQITASPADANRWLAAGFCVDIKVLATDQLSGTQDYQGKPSRILTVRNTSTVSSIQITFAVDNTNILLDRGGVAVYRTPSYQPGPNVSAPTKFYKCWEASFSAGSTSTSTTTFTNIELTLNDTSVQEFQELYVDLNVESVQSNITGVISAESSAPPTARDVVSYNNFTVYGNVMGPPFASVTLISLPNTDNLDLLQVGTTSVAVTYVPNSTTTPADTGVITAVSGTFNGLSNNPNSATPSGGSGYHIVIRPQDPNDATKTAATYGVQWVAIADKLVPASGTLDTFDINITPKAGEIFNIAEFPTTGLVAVIQSKTTGYVVAIFSYQSYVQVPASGFYTFSNCLAYGTPFSGGTWGAGGLQTSAEYVLYPIAGTNISALDVYAIGSDATGYSNQVGFSLAATYECFTTRLFNQLSVGIITSVTQVMPATAFEPLLATINFTGVYSQLSADLLDQCVRTLCDTYNIARAPEDPYAVYSDSATSPAGQIRFESIYSGFNRFSSYTTSNTYNSGTGFYDQVVAKSYRISGNPTVKYAEPITSTLANIMQQSVQTIAGITISKFNKPEEIPIGQNLEPLVIGDPLKPIIKMVNQYNQLLIFKQNEGTYRIDVQQAGGGVVPFVNINTLLDNTAWLLLPESVQEFEGTVIYFSNKAFTAISSSGSISPMSPTIATESLNAYGRILEAGNTDKVRSWTITQQRLYCCYFPFVNDDLTSQTYVFSFDTQQWTKWSGEISDVAVSAYGQLSLVENVYNLQEVVVNNDQLNIAQLDTANKYWSVIRQGDFQNPSPTQIEDTIPLTGFTINTNLYNSVITITNYGSSNIYSNLYKILPLFKDRTIWYLSNTNGYYISQLVAATDSTSISLQIIDENGIPIVPLPFTPTTADSLSAVVNTAIYFNKFFIATPRGSTLSHFNEVQLYTQEGQDYSYLRIGFNSTGQQSQYVITTSGDYVVTTSGSFVVVSTDIDSQFFPYFALARSQYTFRVLIPIDSGRGRFIQCAIKHDTPEEIFILNSLVYIYRDTESTKIKAHSSSEA